MDKGLDDGTSKEGEDEGSLDDDGQKEETGVNGAVEDLFDNDGLDDGFNVEGAEEGTLEDDGMNDGTPVGENTITI